MRQLAAALAGYTHAIKGASKLAHSKGFASAKKLSGKMHKLQGRLKARPPLDSVCADWLILILVLYPQCLLIVGGGPNYGLLRRISVELNIEKI